ncbi:death ligand signal enhancer [Eucyclogobius newberryi]|uniref:death ligand signal enhancer n=1 Tax=Eucyclogobius newberryi TaxID=166745 RepID=UPI003B58C4D0
MWRVQGLVGRVLHRYHANGPLRLPQNHHVEDEVINTSSLLSNTRHCSDSSSQGEEGRERRRKQRTSHFAFADLPRYTALDAVGWGAAAVLFMQMCRRIHSQLSSGSEPRSTTGALTETSSLRKCGYRILLESLSRRDILPRGRSVLCLKGVPETQTQDLSINQSSSSNSEASELSDAQEDLFSSGSPIPDHQRTLLDYDLSSFEDSLFSSSSLDNIAKPHKRETVEINDKTISSENEKLVEEAAQNVRHVGDTSVPVILNIIGLQNANNENYEEAFSCFLAAAQLGYTKAQFNTGVCYEKGRGVSADMEKAMHYYGQAAAKGHAQAQYRYAKLLLTSRGQLSEDEQQSVTNLLEEASSAGLTKAQVCLASVYSQKPEKDWNKSVLYLKMAAESGDNNALLFLGQCYEKGLGVTRNGTKAVDYYRKAAKAGNKQAKSLLESPSNEGMNTQNVLLRSIRSVPCFQRPLSSLGVSDTFSSSGAALPAALMPHSWSTGSLFVPPALPSLPLHLLPQSDTGDTCKWTLGIV